MNKPTIYSCAERQPIAVPMQKVLSPDGTIDILQNVVSKGYFDLDYRSGQLMLVAGKYVGLIPINDRVVIDVRPKVPLKGLLRILNIAGEEIGALDFFKRLYRGLEERDDNVLSLLVRSLTKQLRMLALEGILKLYRRQDFVGPFKARINFPKTLRHQWSRGNFAAASAECFDFTKDNALNRLIKYTIWYAGRRLQIVRSKGNDLLEELNFFYNLLERVPLDTSRSFLPNCLEMSRPERLPTIRRYYADIVTSCMLIVGNRSVDIEASGQDIPLLSFVLNLEDVFENYVRNIIKEKFRSTGSPLTVGDGNRSWQRTLFYDNREIPVKPDIVIATRSNVRLVADVKYKLKAAEVDRYQIISHALSYGTRTALLILPLFDKPSSGLTRIGQVHNTSGIEYYEYRFPLDDTLELQEERLGAALLATANQSVGH